MLRPISMALACAFLGATFTGPTARVDFRVSVSDPITLSYDTEQRGDTVLVRARAHSSRFDESATVFLVGDGGQLLATNDGRFSLATDARLALWLTDEAMLAGVR